MQWLKKFTGGIWDNLSELMVPLDRASITTSLCHAERHRFTLASSNTFITHTVFHFVYFLLHKFALLFCLLVLQPGHWRMENKNIAQQTYPSTPSEYQTGFLSVGVELLSQWFTYEIYFEITKIQWSLMQDVSINEVYRSVRSIFFFVCWSYCPFDVQIMKLIVQFYDNNVNVHICFYSTY